MNVHEYCPGCGGAVGVKEQEQCVKCSLPASQPSGQKTLYYLTGGAVSLLVIALIGGVVTAVMNWL